MTKRKLTEEQLRIDEDRYRDLADSLPQIVFELDENGDVRGISPHRLRDAFSVHAVKLNDSGDGLRLLQEYLGHQSITIFHLPLTN